jgi:hypothetical protein
MFGELEITGNKKALVCFKLLLSWRDGIKLQEALMKMIYALTALQIQIGALAVTKQSKLLTVS